MLGLAKKKKNVLCVVDDAPVGQTLAWVVWQWKQNYLECACNKGKYTVTTTETKPKVLKACDDLTVQLCPMYWLDSPFIIWPAFYIQKWWVHVSLPKLTENTICKTLDQQIFILWGSNRNTEI